MTTVTIEACCPDDTVVLVTIFNEWASEDEFSMDNGDTAVRTIYGDRELTVIEVPRSASTIEEK